MAGEDAELDRLQAAYKAKVDTWVTAIRAEEELASVDHTVAQIDGRLLEAPKTHNGSSPLHTISRVPHRPRVTR